MLSENCHIWEYLLLSQLSIVTCCPLLTSLLSRHSPDCLWRSVRRGVCSHSWKTSNINTSACKQTLQGWSVWEVVKWGFKKPILSLISTLHASLSVHAPFRDFLTFMQDPGDNGPGPFIPRHFLWRSVDPRLSIINNKGRIGGKAWNQGSLWPTGHFRVTLWPHSMCY